MNESRRFLSVVIASGLDFDILSPEDVMRHVTMDVLAHRLPVELKADLLTAGLAAKTMTATLVLDTLGLEAIAEYVPTDLLWACVAESGAKALGEEDAEIAEKSEPALEPAPKAQAVPAAKPKVQPKTVARKPNRSAQAAQAAPAPAHVEAAPIPEPAVPTRVPEPDPPQRFERMQTLAENDAEPYFDADTSVGEEPVISEVEYVDDNPYSAEGDEVTAFGQD